MSKYHNCKCNGYDSKAEYRRSVELKLMEKAGLISGLEEQVKFVLVPAQRSGKTLLERESYYLADFVYQKDGKQVTEDVKGVKTVLYVLKRKLMLHVYGIRIQEVS